MKILIIKLGAKGDVVRTLPILLAIKEKYPDSEIHWITKPQSVELLETSKYVDKVLPLSENISEDYDILYNFDIEKEATDLANNINAKIKLGFYSEEDYVAAFNMGGEYYLNTLFDDDIKKTNRKTYQEMMFDIAELPYKKQHHPLILSDNDKEYAKKFIKKNNLDPEKLIGIHIGSASRWPSKSWHEANVKDFIRNSKSQGYEILLFGGPNEAEKYFKMISELKEEGINIYQNNPQNSDGEFASLVNTCNQIICGDSFALHISLALKKSTIGLFFCTSPHEVEDYGILKKVVSLKLADFFPERSDEYDEELVKSISAEEVLRFLNKSL